MKGRNKFHIFWFFSTVYCLVYRIPRHTNDKNSQQKDLLFDVIITENSSKPPSNYFYPAPRIEKCYFVQEVCDRS